MKTINLQSYYPKVKYLAFKFYNSYQCHSRSVDVDDLYHEGLIALHSCKQAYKPEKKVSFWTYAQINVSGKMLDYLHDQRIIRIPKTKRSELNRYKNEYEKFCMQYKRNPSDDEMAELLDLPVEKLKALHKLKQLKNHPADTEDSDVDYFFCDDQSNLDEQTMNILKHDLEECFSKLTTHELIIFKGIFSGKMKIMHLAQQLGLSKNTIVNKNKQAKTNLAKCMKVRGWEIDS